MTLEERYIKYFKAWNTIINYQGFNLDRNNDLEFECVPNASFKTYGTKKETSNQNLHSVHKGDAIFFEIEIIYNTK